MCTDSSKNKKLDDTIRELKKLFNFLDEKDELLESLEIISSKIKEKQEK